MNINEEDYKRFKKLLEYFVAHSMLRAKNLKFDDAIKNDPSNPMWKILKEAFDNSGNKEFRLSGQGHNEDNIQNQIKKWDKYNHVGQICISIDGTTRMGGYLLHWYSTEINIKAEWENITGKTIKGGLVTSLKIVCNNIDTGIKNTLNDLGLFDDKEPNECLKDFFNSYIEQKNSYIEQKKTLTDILAERLENVKNLILTGAPGTGKTYIAKKIAEKLAGKNIGFVQFHPSYDYSDFVEGLRPVKNDNGNIAFERKDGIFKEFCKQAVNNQKENFVFIIDEINRGELSKIFGELFYSIDPGYRGKEGKVCTQYQNLIDSEDTFHQGFYIPDNVYIIGTMNDIDRSIESMDFAMRRRFAFFEIKANDRTEMWYDKENGLDEKKQEMAKKLMDALNNKIDKIPGLGTAYHIGPSYFLKLKDNSKEELWNNFLKGLLFEYLRGMPDADKRLEELEDTMELNNKFKS